jgi:hypothetical protein
VRRYFYILSQNCSVSPVSGKYLDESVVKDGLSSGECLVGLLRGGEGDQRAARVTLELNLMTVNVCKGKQRGQKQKTNKKFVRSKAETNFSVCFWAGLSVLAIPLLMSPILSF